MELFFIYDRHMDLLGIELEQETAASYEDADTIEVHEVDLFAPTRIIQL